MVRAIGLMSGTSMDGIDAALIDTDGHDAIQELTDISLSYDAEFKILLKAAERAVRQQDGNLSLAKLFYSQALSDYLTTELNIAVTAIDTYLQQLSFYFHHQNLPITFDQIVQRSTELHATAIKTLLHKANLTPKQIDLIGYHGQTLFHYPAKKITIQVGDGERLAELTGIAVINDFRSQDVNAGGQGAPLAPLYHRALALRDKQYPVVVVNCGGIANVSVISGAGDNDILGFDTGPGNGLIDRYIKQKTAGKEHMDTNGQYGRQGKIHEEMMGMLYAKSIIASQQNFFQLPPPKSLDINQLLLIPEMESLSLQDACATLEAFTADSIANSIHLFDGLIPERWILSGGGWYNPVIRTELEKRLKNKIPQVEIKTADQAGWNSRAMEAQVFAYLAVRSFHKLPISLPRTTRVPEPLSGGTLFVP